MRQIYRLKKRWDSMIVKKPTHMIALSFFITIAVGAILIKLPISTVNGISTVDAIFMSASAVCVTGLTSVDFANNFTLFGKIVILSLIQIGGLGIMTLTAWILWIVKEKMALKDKIMLEYSFTHDDSSLTLGDFVSFIIKYTLITEFIGAILLFAFMNDIHNIPQRAFSAIFHAISAFCNAGFSTFPDNLERYKNSIGVNLVVAFLIILGGLGFIVIFEIKNRLLSHLYHKKRRTYTTRFFTLHAWLVLRITLVFIIGGTIAIYVIQNFIYYAKDITLLEAFFQSVTCRTAGFNTIDIGSLHSGTLLVMIMLMFIGGSPGSTAGGIKTTTFGTLFYVMFLGKNDFEQITIDKMTVPHKIVYQALLIIVCSMFIITIDLLLLTAIEQGKSFLSLLFETVSAFGTVGLSMGITTHLAPYSKLILSITMFIGRIGTLTIFSIIANREEKSSIKYMEGKIMVG